MLCVQVSDVVTAVEKSRYERSMYCVVASRNAVCFSINADTGETKERL